MAFNIFVHSPQIGNRFALTAAHCLYDDDNEEVLPASSFSLMLGLHDRRKTTELKRLLFNSPYYDHVYIPGDGSESTRFSSMKTSLTPGLTLPYYVLVRRILLLIHFLN